MENAITPALSITIGILLFVVGFLLGERRQHVASAPREIRQPQAPPLAIEDPNIQYHIPKAPPSQPGAKNTGGIRVISPREAIYQEMQKRDGLTEPSPERIPPAVANDFLNEAASNQNHH